MAETPQNARHGVGFIANMNDWKMGNFAVDYCRRFMQVLQGGVVPIKVTKFLIVNPPKWFDKIWVFMKTVLSSSFQKKVSMIPESKLCLHLEEGFERYLPDELDCGQADTDRIAQEFSEAGKQSPLRGLKSPLSPLRGRKSSISPSRVRGASVSPMDAKSPRTQKRGRLLKPTTSASSLSTGGTRSPSKTPRRHRKAKDIKLPECGFGYL